MPSDLFSLELAKFKMEFAFANDTVYFCIFATFCVAFVV